MKPVRFLPARAAALLALAACTLLAGRAAATTCTQSSDCPKGFTCQATGMTACPDIACAPGQLCPLPPSCTPTTFSECVSAPCTSDGDCAADMVCYGQEQTSCPTAPVPTCAPGVKCPPEAVDAGACTTTTIHSCVPRYQLPCQVDADCGQGFTCIDLQTCWCSGSTGSSGTGTVTPGTTGGGSSGSSTSSPPAAGGDSAPGLPVADGGTVDVDAACGCKPSGTRVCQQNTIACSADSDCPAQWTCAGNVVGCVSSNSAGGTTTTCTDAGPAKTCQPPYTGLTIGSGETLSAGNTAPPGAPSASGGGPSAGAAGGGSTAADAGAPSGNQGTPSGSPGTSAEAGSVGGGGCTIGRGPAGSVLDGGAWLGPLALLGLAGLRRRKR